MSPPGSLKTRKRPGGTGVLTCAYSRGGAVLSLVPKLRLGNPTGCKALLCQPYSDNKIITEAPKQSLGHKSVPKRELGNHMPQGDF
jgi:hypothetical protein